LGTGRGSIRSVGSRFRLVTEGREAAASVQRNVRFTCSKKCR
jgi:hypothetical protein